MLYINQQNDAAGVWQGYQTATYTMPSQFGHLSSAAMGVDVGDLDNDGDLDFYVTDWSDLLQAPDGGMNDYVINQLMETGTLDFVYSDELPAVYSWGTQVEDFDNNGWQDVHVATQLNGSDHLYMNSASGFGGNTADLAGIDQNESSRGDQTADYDRDGLLDLLVINPYDGGHSVFYENRSDTLSSHHFLSLKLIGDPTLPGALKSSRDAIGARVRVVIGDDVLIREVLSGSSNAASTSSLDVEVGLGDATAATVQVLWPSGRTTTLQLAADQFVTITELLGDLNGDGAVDSADEATWAAGFGMSTGATQSLGDTNQDSAVNGRDFLNWQRGYGQGVGGAISAAAVIVEPSTQSLGLILIGVLIGGRYVRNSSILFCRPMK